MKDIPPSNIHWQKQEQNSARLWNIICSKHKRKWKKVYGKLGYRYQ